MYGMRLECGCVVIDHHLGDATGLELRYCPKHKAAPDLYTAAQMAYEDLEPHEFTDINGGYAVAETVESLRGALAKARGDTTP